MAASDSITIVKLQIVPGKANPAPPVGTALGPRGVNIMEFCKQFNALTAGKGEEAVPVEISITPDKKFTFIVKQPPVPALIKRKLKLKSGSKESGRIIIGKISREQIKEIAEIKMEDMNATSLEGAMRQVEGSARSMGIELVD